MDSADIKKLLELERILRCAPNLLKQFSPSFNSYGDPLKLERAHELVTELMLDNAPDQARPQPSPEAGCSPSFAYIAEWQYQRLTCAMCGTTKSVKYRLADGRTVCNLCVGKANEPGETNED